MGFQNPGTVHSSGISFRWTSQAVRATLLITPPFFCFQLAQLLGLMFPKRDSLSMQQQLQLFVKLQIGLLMLQSGYLLYFDMLASYYACNYLSSLTGVPMNTFLKGSNHSLSSWHPRTDPNSTTLYPQNRVQGSRLKPWLHYALTFVTQLCALIYNDMTFNFAITVEIVLPKIT